MHVGSYTFQEFKDKAAEFHGYPAPGLLIGGYMVEMAKAALPPNILFEAVVESKKCLPDAVQLLTLCSIGNGWMKIVNLGRYAVSLFDKYTGVGVRVSVDLDKLKDWPQIEGWFLKLVPKKDQNTEELFREIEAAGDTILRLEKVTVQQRLLGHSHMTRIDSCPVCREAYPVSDGAICRGCQGEAPYEHSRAVEAEECMPTRVPVAEAVGRKALHDMTRIEPGQSKGAEFLAGQTITAGDVCRLQQMGRNSVYVQDENLPEGEFVHENDAAISFAARMAGPGIAYTPEPREGKIDFHAACSGLLQVNLEALERFNLTPNVMCATRQHCALVEEGRLVGGTRAIPLFLSRENFSRALTALGDEPIMSIAPLRQAKIGVLVTGTEVFQGLIEDRFAPIIRAKAEALGSTVVGEVVAPDDRVAIADGVKQLLESGADLIVTTAGLSVDPDDVTRKGLEDAGMTDALHGAPILPGAMTLIGRIGGVQVMGVPACALFFKTTSLDVLLPRLLAGVPITRRDLARIGEGGICLQCNTCTYPKCTFAK
ncbi:MAG: FmdE family protein [Desulfomicrobium apsheronum]|nr:FmdE family protein [Desulfomicrobium apsheronum]